MIRGTALACVPVDARNGNPTVLEIARGHLVSIIDMRVDHPRIPGVFDRGDELSTARDEEVVICRDESTLLEKACR
jgi:hypothetical protein